MQELLSHLPCLRNNASAVIGFNSNSFIKGLQGAKAIALSPDSWIRESLKSVEFNRCFNLVKVLQEIKSLHEIYFKGPKNATWNGSKQKFQEIVL